MFNAGHRRRILMSTVVAFATTVLFLSPARAASAARPIAVKSFSAPCEVKRAANPGKWYRARVGMSLSAGDVLRTGAGGKALLVMSDGSRMIMRPNTRLQVEEVAPNRVFGLSTGQVKSFIKKLRGDSKFEIKTPLAAASVRGTVFEVGFDEEKKNGFLDVDEGLVALFKDGQELFVGAGERVGFSNDLPLSKPATQGSDAGSADKDALRREVGLGMSKEEVMAAAADEIRLAEYQEGKVMTDVFGKRVRLEEYIIRRPKEIAAIDQDKAFKLVVLNEREDRFDYFYYRGVFNTALPTDLSEAFREVNGKLGSTAPTYFLNAYEMGMSNTIDSLKDTASGGHLVMVTFDGTDYTLTDNADPSRTKTVAAEELVVANGITYHKLYDPVNDRFQTLDDDQYNAGDYGPAVYDSANDVYRSFGASDTFWRTNFNDYSHALNSVVKQSYTAALNTLVIDQDGSFDIVNGGSVVAVTDTPSGGDVLHNRARLFYSDGTSETYNTYIIGDDGAKANVSAFAGLNAGSAFKNELLKWNYQQTVEATEFQGRKIDLVVEPKILIKSGLIK